MKVPFVSWPDVYNKQKDELDDVWCRCNEEGQLLLRDEVGNFERSLADICGTEFAVGVNSGTDAIWLALEASGIGRGDKVATPSHTFIATIQAIERVGAIPVFIDVGADELIDVNHLETILQRNKIKAVIPVHLTGKVCDMHRILELADKYSLIVIEDAAQAFGAMYKGKRAGGIGHLGCFSFYPFKILGCAGDGGGVTTNDEEYARKLRLLRNHGNVSQTGMDVGEKGDVRSGWNSRLDNIQAGVLNVRLKDIENIWRRREEIAEIYNTKLQGLPIRLPTKQEGRVYQEYVIQCDERLDLTQHLNDVGIEVLPNLKQQKAGLKPNHLVWCDDDLPMTLMFTEKNLRLPIWPTLTDEQINYVCDSIKQFYKIRV